MKYRRAYNQAKAGGPCDPAALSGENYMIGKEVNEPTQATPEGTFSDCSATEDADGPSSFGEFESLGPTIQLVHK